MTPYVAQIAYDGSVYLGWQKTKEGPSIEEELEKVLVQIFQHPIALQAASRTDRGVHATGQVVNWFSDKILKSKQLAVSLNQLLPPDIRILGLTSNANPLFHPTLDASGKHYLYRISRGPVQLPHDRWTHWHIREELDLEKMQQVAQTLTGTHDFKNFCNFRKDLRYSSTVRTLSRLSFEENDGKLFIHLIGDHFLYKMARNIVGLLVYVGSNKVRSQSDFFTAECQPKSWITAPAHGLCLKELYYEKWPQLHKNLFSCYEIN